MCESGRDLDGDGVPELDPNAFNPNNPDGWSTDSGLWQINSRHDPALERLGLDKWDPEDATQFARHLYDNRGGYWTDWVCYTKRLIAMNY